VIRGLLFGVGSADPLTYVAVVVLLTGVALAATWGPARRASRTDALIVMRHE
jgi:putative ABC transport system permease protein